MGICDDITDPLFTIPDELEIQFISLKKTLYKNLVKEYKRFNKG